MSNLVVDDSGFVFAELARKKAIAERFGNAARVYDDKVIVQKQVSEKALSVLTAFVHQQSVHQQQAKRNELALDIGCGTGSDTAKLLNISDNALGIDLSEGMIAYAQNKNRHDNINWLVADAEALPIASHSVGVIYSSMALQWLTEPEFAARECFRVMSPGGKGVIAVVLQNSLFELRDSWQKTGDTPSVNKFLSRSKWLIAFKNSGFRADITTTRFTTYHDNIFNVLHSLKDVGAGVVVNSGNPQPMKKTKLKQIEQLYKQEHVSTDTPHIGALPLSWDIGFLCFEKV